MSESERMPGYLNRSQVPPLASRPSRTATTLPGWWAVTWQAAPMPDRPAPMIRTSTCSGSWGSMPCNLLAGSPWCRSAWRWWSRSAGVEPYEATQQPRRFRDHTGAGPGEDLVNLGGVEVPVVPVDLDAAAQPLHVELRVELRGVDV